MRIKKQLINYKKLRISDYDQLNLIVCRYYFKLYFNEMLGNKYKIFLKSTFKNEFLLK